MPVDKLKETILKKIGAATEKAYGQLPEQLEIGFPPDTAMGHFAVGCFPLAKQFRKSPAEIAGNIVDHFQSDDVIAGVTAAGPYINLKIAGNKFKQQIEETLSIKLGNGRRGGPKKTIKPY